MPEIQNFDTLDLSQYIQAGDTVIWGQAQAEPLSLTENLIQNRKKIGQFQIFLGIAQYPSCSLASTDYIQYLSYCGAGYNRLLAEKNALEILPVHYSTLPHLMQQGCLNIDVVLIQVSAPNASGQYSYSLAHDYLKFALQHARIVIAEVNALAPWVYADEYLSADDFDVIVHTKREIMGETPALISPVNQRIADRVAEYIEDGATLQLGIGVLPNAIMQALNHHRHLGIHSGIIGDGVAVLMQQGVITNEKKNIDQGKTVTGLISGSSEMHRFVHQNPDILLRGTDYTHNAQRLSHLNQFTAINSAIEVDLTGQVNAEIANRRYVGAVGGALDFVRAANQSQGGVSIIALPASGKNFSRIVSQLQGPVSTPRSDVGIIVTEYGAADLRGLSIRQRVEKMLLITDPQFRTSLEQQAMDLHYI